MKRVSQIGRKYKRPSKHKMKLSRYKLSGAIHSNGIGATFCVKWLVTASSNAEAQAASPIHNRHCVTLGRSPTSCATNGADATGVSPTRLFHAANAHNTANAPNMLDQ